MIYNLFCFVQLFWVLSLNWDILWNDKKDVFDSEVRNVKKRNVVVSYHRKEDKKCSKQQKKFNPWYKQTEKNEKCFNMKNQQQTVENRIIFEKYKVLHAWEKYWTL